MRKRKNGSLLYSPSDLIVFMESEFASWMDRFYAEYPTAEAKPDEDDPTLAILQKLGIEHENRYLDSLKSQGLRVVTIADGDGALEATRAALLDGPDVIYQAALESNNFAGRADFLLKVPQSSDSGDHRYNIVDTKLALKPKPYFVIQLCCYAEMLAAAQGEMPVSIGIVLGDSTTRWFRTVDYYFYYLQLKRDFLSRQLLFDRSVRPVPEGHGNHGRWNAAAEAILQEMDHLSQVANIRRSQIKKLEAANITTFVELATSQVEHVSRLDPSTLAILRRQARLQFESNGLERPKYEVVEVSAESSSPRGLKLLPPASVNDIFFDMEGYPYVEAGLEYLFGASYFEDGELVFKDFWAHNRAEEKRAFEDFVDWAYARWQQDPHMHIYHYADYEVSALRRLMGRHATREEIVDALLRNNVFVNLYTVVKQGLCVGTASYSIKKVELLYRPKRQTEVSTAMDSVVAYHNWLQSPDGKDVSTSVALAQIRDYNKDDCDSTAQLAEWLRRVQLENGITWASAPKPEKTDERPPAINPNGRLAQELLENLPADSEDARIQSLLAHLLEFHWRESKPIFWAKFDRHAMTHEQLVDDPNCLGAMRRTSRAAEPVQRSLAYEYAYDAAQDTKLDVGSKCFFSHDLKAKTEIVSIDEDNGLVRIKVSSKAPAPPDMLSLIPDEYVDPQTIADSLLRIVSNWRTTGKLPPAAENLLLRQTPRIAGHHGGPIISASSDALTQIVDVVKRLDGTTLCIQGPPGSGKTFTAAKVIVELLRVGKRVGVTSNSHKAIAKLLREIEAESKRANFKLKGSKLQSDMADFLLDGTGFAASTSADYVFGTGRSRFDLVGGTAWSFSDEAAVGGVDYLFVDEAGQVSLANLLAMSPATTNIVLMGDQMQLSQPIQGAHPGESGQSSLNYLLQGKQTIPEDFGIFLATSFRMEPALCEFISSAVYEGKLHADENAVRRELIPPAEYAGHLRSFSGVAFVGVQHEGNTQCSIEEAALIENLIAELLTWSFQEGQVLRKVEARDILVVAPYNMQVRLLKSIHSRDFVGTVDKFQGQEAPIVIISMCASEGSESARGLEFLFSKNRLNVAISRAQCLAVIVGCPQLARTRCRSIEQIELVNLFCRVVVAASDGDMNE